MSRTNPELTRAHQGDILIVDDTPDNLRLLSKLLKARGFKVRPARNGPQALTALDRALPELVLLDINMPGMNGYEVCKQIKSNARTAELPVIFITALHDIEHKKKGFEAGGVDYITKPFQEEEVLLRVSTHLTLVAQRKQIQDQYERLRQLDAMRENLVQMIAHDIKAPLQSILGFTGLLQRMNQTLGDPKVERYGRAIGNGSQAALDLVQAMLDVARLEAGQMPIHRTRFALDELLEDVKEGLDGLLNQKKLTLELVLPRQNPLSLHCDRELMRRIVVNIASNAIRFSLKGGLVVIEASPRSERWARIFISDEGPGVPDEHKPRLFEKFGEVGARATNQKYSTGLGLAFCKMAVEAHGGEIGVEDNPKGAGTTFWFDLPAGEP